MNTNASLSALLAHLDNPDGTKPANLVTIIEQLLKLLESLPPGPNALDALKKPGAWESVPLTSSTPDQPIWVKLPCAIDFEGMTAAELKDLKAVPYKDGLSSTISVGLDA